MPQKVCLTGASGFLGSWCAKLLLEQGFIVHATVRSKEKAAYLKALPGSERLVIFDGVDLLTPGAFDAAMASCDVCMHTASPFFFANGTEDALVKPAVEGTRNVLDACVRAGVRKVVLTSSTAAVYVSYGTVADDHVWSSADWTSEGLVREKENWYCLSKTAAERVAWEVSRASSLDLCVLNPTLIFGPPHLNTSQNTIVGMMDGSLSQLDNSCKSIVDVRDVAEAHVAAITTGSGWGERFLLIGATPHQAEIADAVREALPAGMKANVPTSAISDETVLPSRDGPSLNSRLS
ncbi:hypothetical protein EMIHUDRAFT_308453 [Emiliania huxleyi CCMP1516]|uniref:NAD-dependent epimerase/dehydratase domain-containing protein n=2 Tax=Emiliania huxleyi TaxID=2903 RepID=A0A0D3JI84_EMIH1|nr:hypothetical protein EMIHUDRAFT_308453 [Emiliania huxleyi CCMP1516]EOD23219.1 hypothetical protein EMIHUDRAFT_308453 [Emiliania huxleyi CCMP1516]|eukprot:XP_005775648.1 hypothetical protein EMIHUDRAFT_308453 [Emiliania huxleyi CCMP1516]